jgi:anti-repressor protein
MTNSITQQVGFDPSLKAIKVNGKMGFDFSLIAIKENGKVDARGIWQFLESKEQFSDWIKRQIDYGFVEGEDFHIYMKTIGIRKNGQTDYDLTPEMAEHLCLMSKTEKGMAARKYYIECRKLVSAQQPKQLTTLEVLELATAEIQKLREEKLLLEAENEKQSEQIGRLMFVNKTYSTTEIAKELNLPSAQELNEWLKNNKYQCLLF